MDANHDALDQFKDTDKGMGIHNIACSFVFSPFFECINRGISAITKKYL